MERIGNLINGEWQPSKTGRTTRDTNPANLDEVIAEFPLSGEEDVRAAVAAAKAALPAWRAMPAPRRGEILLAAWEQLRARKEELATALTKEEGKTLGESRGEVQKALNVLEYTAGEGRRFSGQQAPSELPSTLVYTVREPLGVVALVTPWNFPVAIPVWKLAPALLCGNTAILKPASLTPLCAKILAEAFLDAKLPRGVLGLLYGSGGQVGEALCAHPDVAGISFTGSNEVGAQLYARGAERHKRLQCEMGGKNALVVLEDADLDLAAAAIVDGAFGSTGQRCTATSRVVAHREVAASLCDRLCERAQSLVVGDGMREGTNMGPLVDEKQLESVLGFIEAGKQEGARLRTGGSRLGGAVHGRGYFVQPTLFDRVQPGMRIAQEEIFGPVLSVLEVADFEEAVAVTNGVRYGLSSSIYTRDLTRAFRFCERVETGIVHVNSPTVGGEAQVPFGGMKATGVGEREMGPQAIEFYSQWKAVYVDYTGARRTTKVY